jgi:hypothetical protein
MTKYCVKKGGIKLGKSGNIVQEEEDKLDSIQKNGGDINLGYREYDILPPRYE